MNDDLISIGRIASVNPARREIRVGVDHDDSPDTAALEWLYVGADRDTLVRFRVASARVAEQRLIVTLVAGVTRDAIAALKKIPVWVDANVLIPATSFNYPARQLMGFTLHGPRGLEGTVTATLETRAHEVLEIETPAGDCILIPLIAEWIEDIDWDQRVIVVSDLTPYAVHQQSDATTRVV